MNPKTLYRKINQICKDYYQQRCPKCHKELMDDILGMKNNPNPQSQEMICGCGYRFHRNSFMNYIEEIEKIVKDGLK